MIDNKGEQNKQNKGGRDYYPTTTQIISAIIPYKFKCDDYYLELGKAVHRALELHCLNKLDETSLSEEIKVYVDAYKKASVEYMIEPLVLEKRYYNDKMQYSGKLDMIATINGSTYVVDFKTSKTPDELTVKRWRLQTASYSELSGISKRCVLQWCKNNTWRFVEFKEKTDIYAFYSCLSLFNFLKPTTTEILEDLL